MLRENGKYFARKKKKENKPGELSTLSRSAQSLKGQPHGGRGQRVLTVFLLECLSGLGEWLARACDGVDQIQPKIFHKQNNK